MENNPDAARKFVKSMVQAESYIAQNKEEAKQFTKERFNYEQDYADSIWQDHDFVVELPLSLLIKFEDIVRWRIGNKLTDATEVPNYLDYIIWML